jgi:hypothetical protein
MRIGNVRLVSSDELMTFVVVVVEEIEDCPFGDGETAAVGCCSSFWKLLAEAPLQPVPVQYVVLAARS